MQRSTRDIKRLGQEEMGKVKIGLKVEQKYKKGKHRDEKGNSREASLLEACGGECCQLSL